jgi:hypothetical protein
VGSHGRQNMNDFGCWEIFPQPLKNGISRVLGKICSSPYAGDRYFAEDLN